jgi:WD40 repeat protein
VLTTLSGDQTGLRCVALSSDEQRLAAGNDVGAIKKVKLWNLASGQSLAFVAAHHSPITDVAFWADGSAIVSVSKDTVCGALPFVGRNPKLSEQRQAIVEPPKNFLLSFRILCNPAADFSPYE